MGLNLDLLRALARFHHESRTGAITVTGEAVRILQTTNGQLVMVQSNAKDERLGEHLVRAGLLDRSLIEPLTAEAQRTQRPFGAQLLADGLLKPTDLATAIEKQALERFDAALRMAGQVEETAEPPVGPHVMRQSLGAVTMAAFRSRVTLGEVDPLLRGWSGPRKLDMTTVPFSELSLIPAELRACRRLAGGEDFRQVASGSTNPEAAVRLLAALIALEHLR